MEETSSCTLLRGQPADRNVYRTERESEVSVSGQTCRISIRQMGYGTPLLRPVSLRKSNDCDMIRANSCFQMTRERSSLEHDTH